MIATRKNRALGRHVCEPTFKDIRQACEEIQATWSPREKAKRNRGPHAAWLTLPMIRLSDLVEAITENEQAVHRVPVRRGTRWNANRMPLAEKVMD